LWELLKEIRSSIVINHAEKRFSGFEGQHSTSSYSLPPLDNKASQVKIKICGFAGFLIEGNLSHFDTCPREMRDLGGVP
jgi:hypothetical protein